MPQSFQQLAIRCATCLMLFSEPVVPSGCGTMALRKYFWARISVATCDHEAGTSTSFISNTASPEGLRMTDERFSYLNRSYTFLPSLLKYLSTFSPFPPGAVAFFEMFLPISMYLISYYSVKKSLGVFNQIYCSP